MTLLNRLAVTTGTLIAAAALYALGWLLWMAAFYLNVLRMPEVTPNLAAFLVPPLLLPTIFVAWRTTVAFTLPAPTERRNRRIGIFLLAAALAAIVEAIRYAFPGVFGQSAGGNAFGAVIALVLMAGASVVPIVADRDIRTGLLLLTLTLIGFLPSVVVGRVLGEVLSTARDVAVRGSGALR